MMTVGAQHLHLGRIGIHCMSLVGSKGNKANQIDELDEAPM